MNKLNFLLIWCLFLCTLISCGEKDDVAAPKSIASEDYIPATTGSTWSYGGTTPYTCTATGKTKVIDGKTYTEIESRSDSQVNLSYVYKENGIYYTVNPLPNTPDMVIQMLDENLPVGGTWEKLALINQVDTKMAFSIKAKGISKTVEGKSYENVIHVEMISTYTYRGIEIQNSITTNYFYAKGVGLILTGFVGYGSRPLLSYNLK